MATGPRRAPPIPPDVAAAYDACARLARTHYENFPVASRLLPAPMRPHVAAVYAFARTADDFADEGARGAAERLALLEGWRTRLHAAVAGEPGPAGDPHRDLFRAVASTIAACGLPLSLFDDLVSAFAQDVTVTRYESWAAVLDYCRRSANPVGRLVLRIAGYDAGVLDHASDALCTALQLTNFWQDFAIDWGRGRLYLPRVEADRAGAREADLDPAHLSYAWRQALDAAIGYTRPLFEAGRPVCDGVRGRLRLELRLTWLGGRTILERVANAGLEPARRRPALSAIDAPGLLWRAARWSA